MSQELDKDRNEAIKEAFTNQAEYTLSIIEKNKYLQEKINSAIEVVKELREELTFYAYKPCDAATKAINTADEFLAGIEK